MRNKEPRIQEVAAMTISGNSARIPLAHAVSRILILSALTGICIHSTTLRAAEGQVSFQQPAPISLRLAPETIQMGAFYNGARLRVEGTAPAGSQILVVIRGEEKDEFFNKKGRVGPIWVNVDRIHVTRSPSLFLFYSSADLSSLLDRHSIDTYQLDVNAIKDRLACRCRCKCSMAHSHPPGTAPICQGIEPDPDYRELIRASYVNVKSREGNYQTHPNAVQRADTNNTTQYHLDLDWPSKATPGPYGVEVYACKNRSVLAHTTAVLRVVEVGFPAQMASLASGHPWAYGILAVLAAVVAGFTIDALTSRLRHWSVTKPRGRSGPELPSSGPQGAPKSASEHVPEEEHVHHF
jgi:hypothetical protein